MASLLNPKLANTLDRRVFDAIPIPVFVVDDDVRVLDCNGAAAQFCPDFQLSEPVKQRTGHLLHCLHAHDVPEGCGRGPACKRCVIRNSVASTLGGKIVSRRRMKLQVAQKGKIKELHVLITVCPMPEDCAGQWLLMIEDITHLATLKNLIPICMKCKSVRDDQEYWESLESYVHEHMGVDFSHGLCPKCVNDFYPEYRQNTPRADS